MKTTNIRSLLGRVFKPFDPPQPPLKRGENERQSPPLEGGCEGDL